MEAIRLGFPKDVSALIHEFASDKIYNEYSLKRNNFNPIDKSPNEFVKKLKLRMRLYYDQLR